MKYSLRRTALGAVALLALTVAPIRAEEGNTSKLDEMLNDEVVKALLDEANPEAAFLARLKMMRAHLQASAFNQANGHAEDARDHITHPRTEIYPEIEASMRAHGMPDFGKVLDRVETAYASGDHAAIEAGFETIEAELDKAEAAISPEAIAKERILPDAAALLLRAAVVEYHGAFEFSELSNMVEYHDGAYFIVEARKLLDKIEASAANSNPEAIAKLNASFDLLEKAWPRETPPAGLVMPVTRMQALVSIIELQLNKLQ